jgi:CheY-like chemotaxis protein
VSLKVLIVDDDPVTRRLLARIVSTRLGGEASEAANAMVAFDLIGRVSPDLLLLDLQMPGTGGLEALQRLRNRPQTRSLPIVVLTADSDERTVRRCLALGVSDYLVKPIDPDSVTERLTRLMPARAPQAR